MLKWQFNLCAWDHDPSSTHETQRKQPTSVIRIVCTIYVAIGLKDSWKPLRTLNESTNKQSPKSTTTSIADMKLIFLFVATTSALVAGRSCPTQALEPRSRADASVVEDPREMVTPATKTSVQMFRRTYGKASTSESSEPSKPSESKKSTPGGKTIGFDTSEIEKWVETDADMVDFLIATRKHCSRCRKWVFP